MELHQWLDMPGNEGKATWLAAQLSRTKAAVSLWRDSGVPLALIPHVERITNGAVTSEAMLMHAMRCRSAIRGGVGTSMPADIGAPAAALSPNLSAPATGAAGA